MFTMEQQLAKLEQEASAAQEFRAEARAALEGLRNGVGALKVELRFATSSMEELRRSWAQEVAEVRGELAAVTQQVLALQEALPHLGARMDALQRAQQEQAALLEAQLPRLHDRTEAAARGAADAGARTAAAPVSHGVANLATGLKSAIDACADTRASSD